MVFLWCQGICGKNVILFYFLLFVFDVEGVEVLVGWYQFYVIDVYMGGYGGDLEGGFCDVFGCQWGCFFIDFCCCVIVVFEVYVGEFGVVVQVGCQVGGVYFGIDQVGVQVQGELVNEGFGGIVDVVVWIGIGIGY